MLLKEQYQEEINMKLWEICENFKDETNIKVNYIEYISLLLFIKYLDKNVFNKLYNSRKNYYISKNIDDEIENIKKDEKYKFLFSNIKFSNISIKRNIGEENIICKTIEEIQRLINSIESKHTESKSFIAKAYEYILMKNASNSQVSGEYYTPKEIANMLTNILNIREQSSIYDPACGSGSFLVNAARDKRLNVIGEEKDLNKYNLCATNLFLNDIEIRDIKFETTQELIGEEQKYDYVLCNPPYAQKNWKENYSNNSDINFFSEYDMNKVPIGDYAYVLHCLNSLKENGKMAILLPHGVLFREVERHIREKLILDNNIEAVIGLPENLFYETRIPVVVLIICKNRKEEDVIFIDASKEYKTKKNINILATENQNKILEALKNKKEIEGFSYIASKEKIKNNNYNLAIKKYVTKKFERNKIKKQEILENIEKLEREQNILQENINDVLEILGYKNLFKFKNIKEKDINYNINYREIGKKMRNERIKRKYTQEKMAEMMEISVVFYSRIERGDSKITLERIIQICNILNIEIQDIL